RRPYPRGRWAAGVRRTGRVHRRPGGRGGRVRRRRHRRLCARPRARRPRPGGRARRLALGGHGPRRRRPALGCRGAEPPRVQPQPTRVRVVPRAAPAARVRPGDRHRHRRRLVDPGPALHRQRWPEGHRARRLAVDGALRHRRRADLPRGLLPARLLRPGRRGGPGIWVAVPAGALGAWLALRRRGLPLPPFADALAPGPLLAQAIGRIGNYFSQDLYGAPTPLPWGLEIDAAHRVAGYTEPDLL